MPVALQPKPSSNFFFRTCQAKPWKKAGAFAVNPRGILIHRVKHVETFYDGKKKRHHHVGYWCNNGTCFSLGMEDILTDNPPKDRLLCVHCEKNIELAGQPGSDKLARRHVHRGVLRAHQVCCGGEPCQK